VARIGLVQQKHSTPAGLNPETWVRDGRQMARRDPNGVFDAIKGKHVAEVDSFQAVSQQLKADGQFVFVRQSELAKALEAAGFNAGRHLAEVAQARVDFLWAIALLAVNAALAFIILVGLGPTAVAWLLAFLVLATAVPVEEFFVAYDEREPLREGVFIFLSVVGLTATFWLGGLRGLFLGAVTDAGLGPANEALREAARILQFSWLDWLSSANFSAGISSTAGASSGIPRRRNWFGNVMSVIAGL
jgi:hypothetical protein